MEVQFNNIDKHLWLGESMIESIIDRATKRLVSMPSIRKVDIFLEKHHDKITCRMTVHIGRGKFSFRSNRHSINDIMFAVNDCLNKVLSGHKKMETRSSSNSLSFLLDPGSASAEDVAELYQAISNVYKAMGGAGVSFRIADARQPEMAGLLK